MQQKCRSTHGARRCGAPQLLEEITRTMESQTAELEAQLVVALKCATRLNHSMNGVAATSMCVRACVRACMHMDRQLTCTWW